MREQDGLHIFIGASIVFLTAFVFIFRRIIAYPFCPLKNYDGSVGGMIRTDKIFTIHAFLSLVATIIIFSLIYQIPIIDVFFEKSPLIRICSFIILFLVIFILFGIIVEKSMEKSDKKYCEWKKNRYSK